MCEHMKERKEVKDKDGRTYQINEKMDCGTIGAIYGMHCRVCQKIVYIGKTSNSLAIRFNTHREDIQKENLEKPAGHFCKSGHKASDMEVIAIERVKGDDDVFRVEREKVWIRRMGTILQENKKW